MDPMTAEERNQIEQSAQSFAAQIGFKYFDTRPKLDIKPVAGKITAEGMRSYVVVPLSIVEDTITFGICEDTPRDLLEPLKAKLAENGANAKFQFISKIGWQQLFNRLSIADNELLLEKGDFTAVSRRMESIEPKFMLEPLAQIAYQLRSSDIHIEPGEKEARIRFRIDGTLHPIIFLSKDRYELLTSDLQIRAGVKWGGDVPQGGRVTVRAINDDGEEIGLNMRLETIPSLHGQDVVIRLFNIGTEFLKLESLSFGERQREVIMNAINHTSGLIMTVGPTGSGKTSTLYSIISHLNNDQTKIVTLEDPVEYQLEGISQIPVRSDEAQLFMEKLRAVMREDPNVVMIGEIRDSDTAKTALQASLTGHLVLSTFHAASSAAAVTRLVDMIGQNPLLASSTRLIIAQRLVRKLCESCKTEYKPSLEERLLIKTAFHDVAARHRPSLESAKLYKPVGCKDCHFFGFKGRIALIELMEMTEKLQNLIGRATAATTTQAIKQAAISEGMLTLFQDGVYKALDGQTTLEEVRLQSGE